MKEKLNEVFEALKMLDMKPTPPNVSIMHGVYNLLKDVYKELTEVENNGTAENGPADHPEG
jgi:hypothetical protein